MPFSGWWSYSKAVDSRGNIDEIMRDYRALSWRRRLEPPPRRLTRDEEKTLDPLHDPNGEEADPPDDLHVCN